VFLCREHKKAWAIGANLFSSAMDETPEQQRAEQEEIGFAEFEEVEPHFDLQATETDDHKCEDSMDVKEALDAEDMSEGVKDVTFGDSELMESEEGLIDDFLKAYPYQGFDYICRKLLLPPAEALKRILPLVDGNDWFSVPVLIDGITKDAQTLIEEGWEPGEPSAEPMTDKTAMFTVLDANFEVHLDVRSKWSRRDVAFRMALSYDETSRLLFDYLLTQVIIDTARISGVSNEEARGLLPATDYMLGLPALHTVWEAKSDLLRAELKAKAPERPKPSMAERHEQAARAIEEMEG
jgi:hypothetical protein